LKTETFDNPADFLKALRGGRKKAAKEARPGLPRAEIGEGDRLKQLERIAAYYFWPRYREGIGFDFWHIDGRVTSLHSDYAEACIAAEKELRG
jgi:hypothetical protein